LRFVVFLQNEANFTAFVLFDDLCPLTQEKRKSSGRRKCIPVHFSLPSDRAPDLMAVFCGAAGVLAAALFAELIMDLTD
jgi:hypothetical protein